MKKSGFTLTELLVVLAIIAIASAITAPALSKLMPDKDKIMVLKAYKLISDTTAEVLSNRKAFECSKLSCATPERVRDTYNNIEATDVFPIFFREEMRPIQEVSSGDGSHSYNGRVLFITEDDGMYWELDAPQELPGPNNPARTVSITIDLDGQDAGNNCSYEMTCKKPDRFKFVVDNFGNIHPDDPLTSAYLANPNKLNDKKNDLQQAENIIQNNQFKDWIDHEKNLGGNPESMD